MKRIYLTLIIFIFLADSIKAQEFNSDLFEEYLEEATDDLEDEFYNDCISNALQARYYNNGKSTLEIHFLLVEAYYSKGLYSVAKLVLWDAKRLFKPFDSDNEEIYNSLESDLEDKGYSGNIGYPGAKDELAENRAAWMEFMKNSDDDESGHYKICFTCSGPNYETYYYNNLYNYGKFAYESYITNGKNFNDYLYFLNNFSGYEYFNDAERFVCKKMGALIKEHEDKAIIYERDARIENTKGIIWTAVVAPVSLVALIAGAKNISKNALHPIGVGLGMSGILFSIINAPSHFEEAESAKLKASKERNIANEIRGWYKCSDYLLRQD